MSNMIPLEQIHIASPCHADWNAMRGDDRSRYCGDCRKHVYNLSAMCREEAEALIREREGNLCVRYFQRRDGTILTADCPVGLRVRRRRAMLHAGAVVSVLASMACASASETQPDPRARPAARTGRVLAKTRPAKAQGQPAKTPAPPVKMGEPPTVKHSPPQLMGKPVSPQPVPPPLMGAPAAPNAAPPAAPAAKNGPGGFGARGFLGGIGAGPLPKPAAPEQPAAPHQEPV